jgi:hypothetical protein
MASTSSRLTTGIFAPGIGSSEAIALSPRH